MPANLTQQYKKAEDQYRRAETPDEELKWLQVMLSEIPKHKGTDHLQAKLKAQISDAKKAIEDLRSGKGKKGSAQKSCKIPRQGAGTAVIIGGPNAGKSQLLATFTRATPEVAAYPFTTQQPQPGMMAWENVFVQLIDTPPITTDFMEAAIYGFIRSSELVLLMLDLASDDGVEQCQEVLARLAATKTRLARETYLDEEDLGLSFTRTFLLANKIDADGAEERLALFHELFTADFEEFRISANDVTSLETLRTAIYDAMNVIRVYTKAPAQKEADRTAPFTLPRDATLLDLAEQIHKDYAKNLKFGKVWGAKVHDGTPMKGDYVLADGDVVELHVAGV